MKFISRILGHKSSSPDNAAKESTEDHPPIFVGKQLNNGAIYEIYKSTDVEGAKVFLKTKEVDKREYYIVVETPNGNWGKDIMGLYLEHLLPWQLDLKIAQVDGLCVPNEIFGMEMAAKGHNDNFVVKIMCGKCEHNWLDGVRYQNDTVVRCPKCNTYNKVDSRNIQVWFKQ